MDSSPRPIRSPPRALHRDNHASGSAACSLVTRSSVAPQTTKHEGNGATCSAPPNLSLPFKKRTLADPATSLCQYAVSGRAGIKPMITSAFPCSTSALAFAVQLWILRPYGGFIYTVPNQGNDNPSSA